MKRESILITGYEESGKTDLAFAIAKYRYKNVVSVSTDPTDLKRCTPFVECLIVDGISSEKDLSYFKELSNTTIHRSEFLELNPKVIIGCTNLPITEFNGSRIISIKK